VTDGSQAYAAMKEIGVVGRRLFWTPKQQSRRELTSAVSAARVCDAAISKSAARVRVGSRTDPQSLGLKEESTRRWNARSLLRLSWRVEGLFLTVRPYARSIIGSSPANRFKRQLDQSYGGRVIPSTRS
jgi:hypothetical protein